VDWTAVPGWEWAPELAVWAAVDPEVARGLAVGREAQARVQAERAQGLAGAMAAPEWWRSTRSGQVPSKL